MCLLKRHDNRFTVSPSTNTLLGTANFEDILRKTNIQVEEIKKENIIIYHILGQTFGLKLSAELNMYLTGEDWRRVGGNRRGIT